MNNKTKAFLIIFSVLLFPALCIAADADSTRQIVGAGKSKTHFWPAEMLHITRQKELPRKAVTIAVVDDGFRFTHKSLRDYLFTNTKEIAGNYQDDDGNGYIDDVRGWDVSNNDNDASVLSGREHIFYHGTYVSGIITSVFERFFGDTAHNYLRIIPVKAVPDNAKNTYLTDGYKGIKYALTLNPDIICCAWSGGGMTDDDRASIREAIQKGILVIGSAGNFFTEKIEPPASMPGVVAIAAVDSTFRKFNKSNFGMPIDFSAPGVGIYGAYASADNAFIYSDGTSPAAAIAAGCFAALKAGNPDATASELMDAVKNTCTPIDHLNLPYAGKLGAGVPNMTKAGEFLKNNDVRYFLSNPFLPKGKIFYKKNQKTTSWDIRPAGAFKGLHLYASQPAYRGWINIYGNDSLQYSGEIAGLHKGLFVKGSAFRLELQRRTRLSKKMNFNYHVETIDSTTLYCSDTQYIEDEYGTITDNSGDENYANNSACKWQITVPEGKRILIEFEALDTQPNTDFVWIFDGTTTQPDYLLAKLSGNTPPPHIISLSNKALIWFVTDDNVTRKGWKLRFTAVGKN